MRSVPFAVICIPFLLSVSCKVGPNYSRPPVPTPAAYRGPDGEPTATAPSLGDEKWTAVFNDPALQALIATALKSNFDVQIAATRILQSQQNVTITRSNEFPNVSAGPAVQGLRQPGISRILPAYSYVADALTINASWNIDFWGRYRRATESARASLRATEWARSAVISSLVAQLASAYFQLREDDLELEIDRRTLASRQQSLQLTKTLEEGGATSLADVRQAEQLVEEAAGSIPLTEQAIQQAENEISLLLGQDPKPINRGIALAAQPNPATVPPGIPSQLLERRPDIREAEQNLVAANAQIGVARAQLFPQIPLTGDIGFESIGLGNLFTWGNRTWTFAGNLTQPIFNSGALRANVRLSQAQQQQYLLTYEQTIQTAFREVSDSLIAYRKTREFRTHQEALTDAARAASDLAHTRYQGGVTGYLEVLTNETNLFSAELGLARARLNERLTYVQLYNTLGGGWQ